MEGEAYPKSREAFPEEEDYVGDSPPEGCLGAGCRSEVEARSSEVYKTQRPHEWTREVVLFQVVGVLGEGA